jgi:uncharacterized membrane protein YgdD (TMEM256/DUF423 family)
MNSANAFRIAAVIGFLAVALGAFGAHALKSQLMVNGTLAMWEKAVLFHLVHAVVLLLLGTRIPLPLLACWLFVIGILLFSGSLYIYAVSQVRWLMMLTPLGGLSLLSGWLALAFR